jgi:hypothetical protein
MTSCAAEDSRYDLSLLLGSEGEAVVPGPMIDECGASVE